MNKGKIAEDRLFEIIHCPIAYTGVVARCLNFTVYAILMQLFCVAGLKLGRDAMFFIQPNCPQFKCFLAGNSQRATTPV